jgi:hypothetical protein
MKVAHWLLRYRAGIYISLCAALLLGAALGVLSGNASAGTAAYACLLCMLCLMPSLWMERVNDRYALLAVFMGAYFLFFGALSLKVVLLGSDTDTVPEISDDFMTAAQLAVLLGAGLVLAGYRLGASMVPRAVQGAVVTDWSNTSVLGIGLACSVLGSGAMVYYTIFVTPENTVRATSQGLAAMGPVLTFLVMLGQLIQPLGLLILAYGYAKNRTPFWLGLVLALILLQLILGFAIDSKGVALLGILMVAITQTLWDNKLSKAWLAGVVVFAIVIFPVFQAARVERGERGLDRQQAVQRLSEVLARAWESREKVNEGKHRSQTFLERSSNDALELIFEHVGVDKPFLNGGTLVALPYAFIPRLLIPDKEDVPVGQLFNHVFLHGASDDFTYISVSELGEFYWNFGWPGVIFGMLLTGLLLGFTGAKSSLAEVHSLTRLLVLVITIKMLCFGFGGSIALSYVIWMRAMAAIGLLHLAFARASPDAQHTRPPAGPATGQITVGPAPRPRLSNFL